VKAAETYDMIKIAFGPIIAEVAKMQTDGGLIIDGKFQELVLFIGSDYKVDIHFLYNRCIRLMII